MTLDRAEPDETAKRIERMDAIEPVSRTQRRGMSLVMLRTELFTIDASREFARAGRTHRHIPPTAVTFYQLNPILRHWNTIGGGVPLVRLVLDQRDWLTPMILIELGALRCLEELEMAVSHDIARRKPPSRTRVQDPFPVLRALTLRVDRPYGTTYAGALRPFREYACFPRDALRIRGTTPPAPGDVEVLIPLFLNYDVNPRLSVFEVSLDPPAEPFNRRGRDRPHVQTVYAESAVLHPLLPFHSLQHVVVDGSVLLVRLSNRDAHLLACAWPALRVLQLGASTFDENVDSGQAHSSDSSAPVVPDPYSRWNGPPTLAGLAFLSYACPALEDVRMAVRWPASPREYQRVLNILQKKSTARCTLRRVDLGPSSTPSWMQNAQAGVGFLFPEAEIHIAPLK